MNEVRLNDNNQTYHEDHQYTWLQIIMIWALVSLPMLLVYTEVPTHVATLFGVVEAFGIFFVIIIGLMWQFVVGMIILKKELKEFTWTAIKNRVKLFKPVSPKTGKAMYAFLLVGIVGAIVNMGLNEIGIPLDDLLYSVFPKNLIINRDDLFGAIEPGQWWILLVFLWSSLFNYFLGEEFIFRGILMPKLKGVAGKYDWVLGGCLFGFYHLHLMVSFPSILATSFTGMFLSKKFKSNWIGIIVHGVEGVILILLVTLGLFGVISV